MKTSSYGNWLYFLNKTSYLNHNLYDQVCAIIIAHHILNVLICHMGAETQNSFKGVARGPLYCKLTTRHHRLRDYVSPNQSCKVFGDFGQKSWLTSRHVCGHVTRATCLLGVPWDGPGVVDSFRHWNFSICSKNIGVMAILVEGYNSKIFKKF